MEVRRRLGWLTVALPLVLLLSQCGPRKRDFSNHEIAADDGQGSGAPVPLIVPGDACAENGLTACAGPSQRQRLVCEDGVYRQETPCAASENCDQISGNCSPIVSECSGKLVGARFCDATGALKVCGLDLVRLESEECNGTCSNGRCVAPGCGDGVTTAPEQCDDGNTVDGDGCTNECIHTACGDGVAQPGEECDDGNAIDTDACVKCRLSRCGDGFVGPGEACDDGNSVNDDACANGCMPPSCGDGTVQAGEVCGEHGRGDARERRRHQMGWSIELRQLLHM